MHTFPMRPERGFVERVLIVYGIGAVFLLLGMLLWYASSALLLVFSSILVAVLLHDACCGLERRLPLSRGPALALVMVLGFGAFALMGWFLAPQVAAQTNQLVADMPAALQRVRDYLSSHPQLQEIVRMMPPPEQILKNASTILTRASTVFSGVLGAIGNVAIVLFVAISLAYRPEAYTKGILKLVPPDLRQ